LDEKIGAYLAARPKRVLVATSVDRWGMAGSFAQAGYTCLYGDMLFSLGIGLPLYKAASVKVMAALLMPVVGRLPFHWVYPTGKEQDKRTPKWVKWFDWATVIAGDCHYITKYMPDRLEGKVIATNTTTPEDVSLFRGAGVKYLLTTTPVLDGRSFGTNMMEAAILAAVGRRAPVDYAHPGNYFQELDDILRQLQLEPQIQELNP
jgi:hypothetical protein